MNTSRTIISFMLLTLAAVILAVSVGCATVPTQLHGDIPVSTDLPTWVLGGPATGHWAEQDERPLVTYVVQGDDCTHLAFMKDLRIDSNGRFSLRQGETFCAMPLRLNQRLLFHAERK